MPTASEPSSRHTADAVQTRDELAVLRPDLVQRYDAELAGARAAVLGRLLGAVDREPLPGLTSRGAGTVTFRIAASALRGARPGAGTDRGTGWAAGWHAEESPTGVEDRYPRAGDRYPQAGATVPPPRGDRYPNDGGEVPDGRYPGAGLRDQDSLTLRFPAAAAVAFAQVHAGLTVRVHTGTGATAIDDPGELVRLLWGDVALAAEIDNSVANLALGRANRGNGGNGAGRVDRADRAIGADPASGGERAGRAGSTDRADRTARADGPGWPDGRAIGAGWASAGGWADGEGWADGGGRAGDAGAAGRGMPGEGDPDGLGLIEQLVVDGHPLHPCCRTRGGMSVADVLAYAPEHSPIIRLRRLRVPAERWYGTGPPVLLAHPWQAGRLRERYPWLADDGETGPARPLMSLRTVAPLGGGAHVKTAVDVQMTSAVRTVSPAAVTNGPLLSALMARLTVDLPLTVLAETTAGAVLIDGEPQRDLAFLTRQAPRLAEGETAVPLGVFGAAPVLLERIHDAYDWWLLLCDVLFAPLMAVLKRGVALEAHGQNTLVVLRDGRPHRILYRDFGGVRVSAARLRAAGLEAPPLRGDLPNDDPVELRTKVAAAALGNAAADLIAAFARRGDDPERLWRITAEAIRGTGTADAAHLLRDPLPIKATTAMRLAADPLDDLWAFSDNPLAAHA